MKFQPLVIATVIALVSAPVSAADWMSRVLKTSAKQSRCLAEPDAAREARERVSIDSSNACRSTGYGWHLERIVAEGSVACNSCSGGKSQCQVQDMTLECRRLKSGSAGLMGVFFSNPRN